MKKLEIALSTVEESVTHVDVSTFSIEETDMISTVALDTTDSVLLVSPQFIEEFPQQEVNGLIRAIFEQLKYEKEGESTEAYLLAATIKANSDCIQNGETLPSVVPTPDENGACVISGVELVDVHDKSVEELAEEIEQKLISE